MSDVRRVFFISDRTGVTAESFGESLLNQFEQLDFKQCTIPFVDTIDRGNAVLEKILIAAKKSTIRPIVFSSIVAPEIRHMFDGHDEILHVDYFDEYVPILEEELNIKAKMGIGLTHGITNEVKYDARMDAVNFALDSDDGITDKYFAEADVILIGVSRSGKTPTCLYLALQYGVRAANYPLTPDDFGSPNLPPMVRSHKHKLFGLTIEPARLSQIRTERRSNSKYASLDNCQFEVNETEALFRQYSIPFMSTTHKSVEELAAAILQQTRVKRRC